VNAAQAAELAQALAQAFERAGIVVQRGSFTKGNLREYERLDPLVVAARTVGAWLSWSWVPSVHTPPAPPPLPQEGVEPQSHLRLVGPEVNNDDEDDGA
jgi:hypothetical protein